MKKRNALFLRCDLDILWGVVSCDYYGNNYGNNFKKSKWGGEELVVVKKRDFEAFWKWQEQINNTLLKVKRGREEYKKGKTIIAFSLRKFR